MSKKVEYYLTLTMVVDGIEKTYIHPFGKYPEGEYLEDIKGFVKDTYGYKAKEFEWIGHSVEEKVKNG